MTKYQPTYPILNPEDLLPRDEIQLPPPRDLHPFAEAELKNLCRGVAYKTVVADTPQNRETMATRAGYYQMVAYKEGWHFDPQLYQVVYVHLEDPCFQEAGIETRMYQFDPEEDPRVQNELAKREAEGGRVLRLSPNDKAGFQVEAKTGRIQRRLGDHEVDQLTGKVLQLFRR